MLCDTCLSSVTEGLQPNAEESGRVLQEEHTHMHTYTRFEIVVVAAWKWVYVFEYMRWHLLRIILCVREISH